MTENEIKNIINDIAAKVMERIDQHTRPQTAEDCGALVVIPAFVPDSAALAAYITEHYEKVTCAAFEELSFFQKHFPVAAADSREDRQQLVESLKCYSHVVLAAPPIALLKRIADGEDEGFIEQIVTRAILWDKEVEVILDYTLPRQRRGPLFERVSAAADALSQMGVKFVTLGHTEQGTVKELTLITEAEVIDAQKNSASQIRCAPDAIVTPLANDKARELGILIERG